MTLGDRNNNGERTFTALSLATHCSRIGSGIGYDNLSVISSRFRSYPPTMRNKKATVIGLERNRLTIAGRHSGPQIQYALLPSSHGEIFSLCKRYETLNNLA